MDTENPNATEDRTPPTPTIADTLSGATVDATAALAVPEPQPVAAPWIDRGKAYPLFGFDLPQTVKLPNGTIHNFRVWDRRTEVQRENLLKMVMLTSAGMFNGERPRDVKTDFTKSNLYYYRNMIETFSGVRYSNGAITIHPEDVIVATQIIDGKPAMDLLGIMVQRDAAARLYTGKIDVDKPEAEEEDEPEFDPFNFEDDIDAAVQEAATPKTVYELSVNRSVKIRQEFGVELLANGQTTEPTHVVKYVMAEPSGDIMSRWELKALQGFAVSRKGGGDRAERFYNLTTVEWFFDTLIEEIQGASINGQPIELDPDRDDPSRKATLAKVPLWIKKVIVLATVEQLNQTGNS